MKHDPEQEELDRSAHRFVKRMRFGIGFIAGAILSSYLFCGVGNRWRRTSFPFLGDHFYVVVLIVIVCAILGGIALIVIWKNE